jgi:3-oxoacyl-[acyl-carrier-protein] synthase II
MKPVAVTGVGVVSALGHTFDEYVGNLDAGVSVVRQAPWADPANGRHSWISPVTGFDPTRYLDAKTAEGTDLFTQYALAAAQQAIADRGLDLDPSAGVVLGTTMAGVTTLVGAQRLLDTEGPDAVPRKLNIMVWPNLAAGQVAIAHHLHGPLLTVSSACASGLDAIALGTDWINAGRADVVVAGGTERGLCDVLYYSQLSYGMSQVVADPALATMPFDRRRTGLVEGEGAAVVVLEDLEKARARGARIYGVIRGYASLADGYHPSAPDPSGEWEAAAISRAQAAAGVTPGEVDGVIAHATSTPKGDTAEKIAINAVFGDRRGSLPVTSIKGSVGHTGAASGPMGLLLALHAIDSGRLAHIPTTHEVEDGARFDVVTDRPHEGRFDVMQVNSFGFGGQNCSIVVGRA